MFVPWESWKLKQLVFSYNHHCWTPKVLIIEMGEKPLLLMVVFQPRESAIGTICGGERSRKCISLTKLFNLALPPIILGSVEKIGLISNGNPYLSPISSHFSIIFCDWRNDKWVNMVINFLDSWSPTNPSNTNFRTETQCGWIEQRNTGNKIGMAQE